jgi:hypothetical protein
VAGELIEISRRVIHVGSYARVRPHPNFQATSDRSGFVGKRQFVEKKHIDPNLWPSPVLPVDGPDWKDFTERELVLSLARLSRLQRSHPAQARELLTGIAEGTGLAEAQLTQLTDLVGQHL